MKVLVTGGAGFIGSHTVDLLVDKGFDVVILDNLEPQVHRGKKPDYLNPKAKFVLGDVTNSDTWKSVLKDINAVIHLAAVIGVKQTISQPAHCLNVNTVGTAKFYEILLNNPKIRKNIEKIIIASSASIYGEGAHKCKNCGMVYPNTRTRKQLERKDWEIHCPRCDEYTKSLPANEENLPSNISTYAISKYAQEKLALNYASTLGITTAVLRYFNVFGPRQSLSNPYTGVCAIFSSRIKNNNPPIIYEDGKQTRDFIYVEDVARANLLCLEKFNGIDFFNMGTGNPINILKIAEILIKLHNSDIKPRITGDFRVGDVRHAFGEVSKIKRQFGPVAKTSLEEGFKKLIEWCQSEKINYLGG